MRDFWLISALSVLVSLACGCGADETPAAAGNVAVVDLDEVLRRLGKDVQISQEIKTLQEQLSRDLARVQSELKKQLEDKKREFGEAPTEEQQEQLNRLEMQLNARFQQAQMNTRNEWDKHRQLLVSRFREEVRPVCREVAAARGCNVVLTKDPGHVFSVDPAVEITEEVIGRLARSAPQSADDSKPNDKK